MDRRFGNTVVTVQQGDITRLTADAIVNAANTHLWMGGGVAGAIKRAGGEDIEREAMGKAPIEAGQAVATGAGRLPCSYVIHAATMGQDLATDGPTIRAATRASLRAADDLALTSLALPALGTGVGGFPLDEAAQLMLEEITAYLRGPTGLRSIILVGLNAEASEAFTQALEDAD